MHERVLLITGASSGIGAATARAAAAAGFRLVLAARREAQLTPLCAEIGAERAIAVRCDVTSWDAQQQLVARALDRYGQLDAVFANAGIGGRPGGFRGADPEYWKTLLLTNVYGVALTLRASLAALQAARGHILITGSIAGRRSIAGSMYGVSKWALTGLGANLREELRGTGIRVTLIEPGMTDTPFFDTPKPEGLRPQDVARCVVFALQQPPGVDVHELTVLPTPPVDT
ncbi:MAG: SDR family oxidoreductase [Gammaproteobacteria bacterium]|nr:SDR family oxidoreductase [Gammaproteobacteria bacterium]